MSDVVMSNVEFVDEIDTEDKGKIHPSQISQVVLSATDWTTETIISQFGRGNIDLKPRFQRRDAWTTRKKSRFIESLLLGLPIPQIVLAERKGERGRYLVLDGKQRLLTLLQFTGKLEGKYNNFKLTDLEVREDLKGLRYDEMHDNLFYREDTDAFLNQTIRTVVIRNWPNVDFLHTVFLRLNTGSVPLSPQELRQALFPGEFANLVDDKAAESVALRTLLGNKEPDFRMRDVELLVRHLAFVNFISDYAGNMSGFLDSTCEKLNSRWENVQENVLNQIDEFERSVSAAENIFGVTNTGRKWTGHGFEKRLNRAVLDVVLFYFSDQTIRKAGLEKPEMVLNAFKQLCETNDDFRNSIETTTKSMKATFDRFHLWGSSLSGILPVDFPVPTFDKEKNRIKFTGFNA